MGLQIVKNSDSTPRKVLAAVYARVSTINNGQDPTMQTRELTEYCQRRGWAVYDTYVDDGFSGKKDSRPQLNRMMRDAHARRFDVVICWRFDRFSRSVSHLCRALETFHALDIQFVSMIEQVDTTTPTGKLVFTILGAVAEGERLPLLGAAARKPAGRTLLVGGMKQNQRAVQAQVFSMKGRERKWFQ